LQTCISSVYDPLRKQDGIMKALHSENVSSAIYYPVPLHRQEVFGRQNIHTENLTNSEICAREVLSLPMFPELGEEEIEHVSKVINYAP